MPRNKCWAPHQRKYFQLTGAHPLHLPKSGVRWLIHYRVIISTVLQFFMLIWKGGPIFHMRVLHSYSHNYYITECRKNQFITYPKAQWKRGKQRHLEIFLDITDFFLIVFVYSDNVISCTLHLKLYLLNDLSAYNLSDANRELREFSRNGLVGNSYNALTNHSICTDVTDSSILVSCVSVGNVWHEVFSST